MRHLLVLVVILSVLSALHAATAAKPNIIFILSDDLAQGDVCAYGQKLIPTTRLERKAR